MSSCWNCGARPPADNASRATPYHELSHLLTTNDPPEDAEVPIVRSMITSGQDQIAQLNQRIERLKATVTRLLEERSEMEELVRQHTTVLSPIRRLPAELLCEVFSQVPSFKRLGSHTVSCPPWRLGHICRYWRYSALGDPYLWNALVLAHFPALPVAETAPISMIEAQYLRSANEPLEVTVSGWESGHVDAAWLNLLYSQCHRWGRLTLPNDVNHWTIIRDLELVKSRLSQLQMVEVHHWQPNTDIFSGAPLLRQILLTDSTCRQTSPTLPIPWNQITHYRGAYPAHHQLQILKASPNLIECGLGFGLDSSQVNNIGAGERSHFLGHLEAPALKTLILTGEADPIPSLIRSSCQLTKLILTYCTVSATLSHVLHSIPTLTHLTLEPNFGSQQGTKELFTAVRISGTSFSSSVICPSLTSFAYGDRRIWDVADSLFAMVHSRVQPQSPCRLSFFRIWLKFFATKELTQRLSLLETLQNGSRWSVREWCLLSSRCGSYAAYVPPQIPPTKETHYTPGGGTTWISGTSGMSFGFQCYKRFLYRQH
ncbi:hypothetical protein B0H11DRAFT_2197368 [Mycena galericulata]|nr:hypothetical protein B0H11DRAFT_2197368 [Mycena galericulata]